MTLDSEGTLPTARSPRDSEPTTPYRRTTEIIAGITTFFTMSYIVIVNPSILSTHGHRHAIQRAC